MRNIHNKNVLRCILLLLCWAAVLFAQAKKDENTVVVSAGWFKPASGVVLDTLRVASYLSAMIDTHRVLQNPRPAVKKVSTTLSLIINSDVAVTNNQDFTVTLTGRYYKKNSSLGTAINDSSNFTLQVNYNRNAGTTYKVRDAITIDNSIYTLVVATVNGVSITDENDQRFRVELRTEADLIYTPVLSETPVFNITKEDITAENIKWDWAPVTWAEYYELEYLHVDDYKADGTRKERSSLKFNFRQDAVRIRVYADEYEMPLVFEQGYLVARLRAVGFKGTNYSVPVYGNWNLSDTGSVPATGNHVFEISPTKAHEADRLNWLYASTFNESGMRSEAVSYADGTLRVRQQVAASPEENKLLVTETLYDHQGRASVAVLPAPVKPAASTLTPAPAFNVGAPTGFAPGTITLPKEATNQFQHLGRSINLSGTNFSNTLPTGFSTPHGISPAGLINLQNYTGNFEWSRFFDLFNYRSQRARIGFVPRFNVKADGGNILRRDYDRDVACDISSVALGTQSGAGKYYSPNNEEKARWQAYVPDAEGYPYLQVKYTNDGTGNVRESSLPGATHKIGGGKTQRYFYGTPSQQELDRYFGNDAGLSSFYKKTLLIDENGQAHVRIHNLKGNLVLSALTGEKPENLEAITGAERMSVTVDLIAENNVLNRSANEWYSSKKLVLAAPTVVELSYRTVSPGYAARYCTGANFCYDCVYDLEITVTDACGVKVFEYTTTIGNLDNPATCTNFTATKSATLNLGAGSYFIAKKLRVNEAAVTAYVNNYTELYTCRSDTLRFMPDIDAACNAECITCHLETSSAVVRRRDGSNPSFYFTKRRPGNNSACMLACTKTGLSECATAYQTMLSDVSPGGQYAEYRDTSSRTETHPLGLTNPSVFPLSVLNDANRLPLLNANWRNPVYDYQTKTGEVALVAIGDDGLPLHRSPASEIVTRDGRQFVLVKYLNDVEDFIRLWEPQWAEALVVYHPEYEYYRWCLANKASYSFDSLQLATATYSNARARNVIDFRNDPFFPASAPSLRADMENRLNNFSTVSGTPVSAAQVAIISVHCGNPNFSPAQFTDCYTTKTLFGTPGAENKEWEIYKGLYRKTKMRVLANERNRAITAAGGFNNRIIGGTRDVAANSLYSGKKRVFKEEDDVNDELELDFAGEEPTLAEIDALRLRYQRERFADCRVCPTGTDLITLLNALNLERKLTASSVTLPGISPLILTRNIVNSFSNNTALQYNWQRVNDPNPNVLIFRITAAGAEQGTLTLRKTKTYVEWDSLFMFDCFQPTGEYTFTMRAIDYNDSTDVIQGVSTCFKMNGCTFERSCSPTPARRDMLTFLQYLFEGNRYRRSTLTVHTNTSHSPHFGTALRSKHPEGRTWQWTFAGFTTAANTEFNARLNIASGSTALMAAPIPCDFSFRIVTPGFSFDSVGFVIAVRRPGGALPGSRYVNNAELVVRSKGGRIFYIAMSNSCYELFDCPTDLTNASPRAERCCGPAPHRGVPVNNCENSLRIVARREADRDFMARRERAADSIRTAYIKHCLESVAETLTAKYNDGMYMVTLYYYDQSGALIKTVPPKGVKPLNDAQLRACADYRNQRPGSSAVYPSHILATTYRYTSFGSLAEKTSPDEGTVKYCYDWAGRNILSRNAVQAANNHASYILYDDNNRIIESGRTNYSGAWQTFRAYNEYLTSLSGKAEVTITTFDAPTTLFGTAEFPQGQNRLRNRPAVVRYQNIYGTDAYAVGYSYDALGNITRMAQYYPALGLTPKSKAVKTTDYTFDKLSGQITRIVYQSGQPDQFVHWLSYDANKRVIQVQTSTSVNTPERLRDADATFYYYQHGPLARIEIGAEKIQGVDYAYTIQGWLKGINGYTTGNGDLDMGRDGTSDLLGAPFAKDVTAQVLNYFNNDYKKIGDEGAQFYPVPPLTALSTGFSKPLYNGNIQSSIMSINHSFAGDARRTFAQGYSYDQANRLRQAKNAFSNGGNFSAYGNDWSMAVDYDLNGNIQRMMRTAQAGSALDNQTYFYPDSNSNNRLGHISDLDGNHGNDLKLQTAGNYRYDAIGRLTADASENISSIQYNNRSKVTAVNKTSGSTTYTYDAFGRRISKTYDGKTDWYVNDALGNPMAVYTITGSEVRWKEAGIYGGRRMGIYRPDVVLATRDMPRDSMHRGLKSYELSNHIGDVLAVVSDRKIYGVEGATAEVQAAHNYYPFGFTMPGRTYENVKYRYGFQGMENEDNLLGENNSYTTEYRQYDPRVGRWLSVDPKAGLFSSHSPYNAMLNNPLVFTDVKGADPINDNPRRVRTSTDRLLAEMQEWGDDPIAGIEEEAVEELGGDPADEIEQLVILLNRLEGNDDPLAGLPYEVTGKNNSPEPRSRRHRGGIARILRVDEAPFEDELVIGRVPEVSSGTSNPPPATGEDWEADVRIIRDAFENAGTVMDIGGTVGDAVNIYEMTREGLSIRQGADVLMRGSRTVSGMGLLGAGIGTVNMIGDIYDDANALIDGDISTGTYIGRSALNIAGGVVGCVPVVGALGSWAIGEFRDWALPRPSR
jgi:RHS repeat-associated protein